MSHIVTRFFLAVTLVASLPLSFLQASEPPAFQIDWQDEMLTISGDSIPGKQIDVWYIEAYCRPGGHDREWRQTVIPHETKRRSRSADGQFIHLRSILADGVTIDHQIRVVADGIEFECIAKNPTDTASEVQWGQPCIRVDRFTAADQQSYLPKCFVFLDGTLTRMPTPVWNEEARYTPGQVWRGPGVKAADVNPRPLNPAQTSNGLIGCFSADESWILASAWQPYHELFQGVITCIHSDFAIGPLDAGGEQTFRGKIYLFPGTPEELLAKYRRDFPDAE